MRDPFIPEFEKDFLKEIEKQSFFKKLFIKAAMLIDGKRLYNKWLADRLDIGDFKSIVCSKEINEWFEKDFD